jgi:hypothetical protein
MDLVLAFADRAISGDGNDDIGQFVITGRFDQANCECYWTKTYIGAHDVYYRGFREGKGIWGVWELPNESGGFHIWPLGQEEGERDHESAEEPAPVEAVAAAVLPGSMAPATAVVGLRNIKAKLTSSHLHQRSNPREMCLRSLTSGTKPS